MRNNFKFLGIILCLATASIAVSCSDDEADSSTNGSTISSTIVGTWGCVHDYYLTYWDYIRRITTYSGNHDDTVCRREEREDKYIGRIVNFKDDGTYSGSSMYGFRESGTWMINDNKLYIDGATEQRKTFEIRQLNNTTLKLCDSVYINEDNYNEGGYYYPHYEYKRKMELEFKRQ